MKLKLDPNFLNTINSDVCFELIYLESKSVKNIKKTTHHVVDALIHKIDVATFCSFM